MGDIRVSVILPSLNVAEYIEKAVQSVVRQSLTDIEIICIDAGSTDGTWEKLVDLKGSDNRIILEKSDRRSYGYQVNHGIDLARGEYIAILETDDFVSEDMYSDLYETAIKDDLDYVKSDYFAYWTQQSGEPYRILRKVIPDENLYEKVIHPIEHIRLASEDWYLWNGIYKKEFLCDHCIRFSETEGAAFQDIGFIHRTIVNANKAEYIHGGHYNYCIDRGEASSNSKKDLFYVRQEYGIQLRSIGHLPEERRFLIQRMANSLVYACRNTGYLCNEGEDHSGYLEWICKQIREYVEEGNRLEDLVRKSMAEDLIAIMTSVESFNSLMKKRREAFSSYIGVPGEYPLAIFGCGDYGYVLYLYLKKGGYTVSCFIDNNTDLWGTYIDTIRVEAPEIISKADENTRFVIANEKYADEIEKQIRDIANGRKTNIYKFSPAEI